MKREKKGTFDSVCCSSSSFYIGAALLCCDLNCFEVYIVPHLKIRTEIRIPISHSFHLPLLKTVFHTHACTHACTAHNRTHLCAHTHTLVRSVRIGPGANKHTHTNTFKYTHTLTQSLSVSHSLTHTYTYTHKYTHKQTHTYKNTNIHLQKHKQTRFLMAKTHFPSINPHLSVC